MLKKVIISFLGILVVGVGAYIFSLFNPAQNLSAQAPPATYCGDGVVQFPNSFGEFEKCDAGPAGSSECTPGSASEQAFPDGCGVKMLGWAYSDNFGWLSLNNENCDPEYLDPEIEQDPGVTCNIASPHFVQINMANEILGFAWNDNIGWARFGKQWGATN